MLRRPLPVLIINSIPRQTRFSSSEANEFVGHLSTNQVDTSQVDILMPSSYFKVWSSSYELQVVLGRAPNLHDDLHPVSWSH